MRRPETLGATASITASIATLSVIAATGAALGLLHPKTAAAATPQAAVAAASTATLTGEATPARAAVLTFLGKDVTWGVKIPTRFGCHAPTAAISAGTTDGTTAQVFLAGQAVPALDELAACGTRTEVNGTTAVKMTAIGGVVIAWTRGDILTTVAAPAADPAHLADVDNHLTAALTGVCANLNPTPADATRNPVNPHYSPYTTPITVDAPAPSTPTPSASSTPTAAPTSTPTPAPTPSPAPTGLPTAPPTGVTGPPLPTPVPSPTAPTSPGAEPTQAVINVQAADPTGPGCGWAFTEQTPPKTDTTALARASQQAQDNARLDLLTRQQQWAADTATYTQALADYATATTAWNTYTDQVRQVVGQWITQQDALDTYQQDLNAFGVATTNQQAFLSEQAAAQVTYNAQVLACASGPSTGATPTPTPSPSVSSGSSPTPAPSSSVVCPPMRPAILDQTAPSVPPQPTAPQLWPTVTPTPAPVPTPTPQPTKKR